MDVIRSTKENDPILMSLLPQFEDLLRQGLEDLQGAIDQGRKIDIKRICHRLSGSAATYGYGLLSKRLGTLEAFVESGPPKAELEIYARSIRSLCERVFAGISGNQTSPQSYN